LAFTLSGCYYDDGPVISLRTPEARLVNKWKYQKFTQNGMDITSTYAHSWAEFKKDKNASFYDDATDYSYYGTWEFSDDFKTLYIDYIDDSSNVWSVDYTILKLRNKEIWMTTDMGSVTQRIELVEY
jgi:hypothetical protein